MCSECTPSHLQQTLDLAEAGRSGAPPNPLVGAVITRNDRVIATGYHARYGGLHAEAEALRSAGPAAEGSTLYCNLEPCSYTAPDKHQPPCTRHIIDAGVRTVVIGQLDPNPHVRGRGVEQLLEAGIEVRVADDTAQFWQFNDVFNTVMALDRPLIHLKTAMSLDGRIATASGDSKWITDEAARAEAHRLRARRDAVAVGIGTVLADDPSLTTRLVEGRQARPVVFDSQLRIPLDSTLVRTRSEELIVVTRAEVITRGGEHLRELERRGVAVVGITSGDDASGDDASGGAAPGGGGSFGSTGPKVDLDAAVRLLRDRFGIRSILVEGGSRLVTAFVAHGLFDRITAFIAPIIVGSGTPVIGDLGTTEIAEALRLDSVTWQRIGEQQMVEGYHPQWLARVQAQVGGNSSVREVAHVHGTC
ncbi:MAG: bifunctional diaminohydroxyphosphoribosylaminopyrimidine deaminase/5-amino-6-(5-phosphoribosylamino)uracil reductase RibD [Alkalispirochaeta sp.]